MRRYRSVVTVVLLQNNLAKNSDGFR